MAVEFVNNGADNEVGFGLEATVGDPLQAVYDQVLVTGATFAYPDNEVVSQDTGDRGGPTGRRRISRGADADMPMAFRHDANRLLEEHAFRTDYKPELSITGDSDLDFLTAGTKLNPEAPAGLQLKAPVGTFAALMNGESTGALVYGRGFLPGNPGNNQAMMIEAAHSSGGFDMLDIYDTYGQGTLGDPFGAPKTEETGTSATLHFGEVLKNTQKGAGGRRALSLLVDRFMHLNAGRFRLCSGWVANDWAFEIPDEGMVTATVTGNGRRWLAGSMTPDNGQAADSHFNDNIPDRQFVVGGEDLEGFYVVGYPNVANPTPVPLLFGDTAVTNYSFSLAGNNEVLTNILGMTGTLVRRGKVELSGSFGYYVADADTLTELQRLGDPDNHYKASQHVIFKDPDGYRKALTHVRTEMSQSGGEGGGDGSEAGTIEFGVEAIDPVTRASILQQWSVFA